ncbi:type II secretion system F family protein [Corynebacterium liangguodongii]|uniref:Type II secretion protein F n=1 Tax=Corynebacterium liangguodongii TaxID=2079535 RepID=A0A2S0WBS9_9CORY|nr:type II secretion system F family protein [Corynebacterium liangguodongii]AWB83229.1 type II secretion protein F [Corynebacterium liangguodongii]PWB98674.1 type II secretion protein F [Corynebacterium liangguodongii]
MIAPALILAAAALLATGVSPAARLVAASEPKIPRAGPRSWQQARVEVDVHRLASDISLFAACFRAGLSVPASAESVADSYGATPEADLARMWRRAAALGALGVEPEKAWADFHDVPGGADLASLVALSNASGAAIAAGCERIARGLTEAAGDAATAKAERAGVLISIPLTAFFLPAFFVLGLIPTAISLGSTLT